MPNLDKRNTLQLTSIPGFPHNANAEASSFQSEAFYSSDEKSPSPATRLTNIALEECKTTKAPFKDQKFCSTFQTLIERNGDKTSSSLTRMKTGTEGNTPISKSQFHKMSTFKDDMFIKQGTIPAKKRNEGEVAIQNKLMKKKTICGDGEDKKKVMTINDYKVLSELGKGSFAKVKLCECVNE